MYRISLASALVILAAGAAAPAFADDRPTLKEALALQEAMESAIKEAEPAIACILVSRSDVYHKWFGKPLHADKPGQLGDFSPGRATLRIPRDELAPKLGGEDSYLTWLHKQAGKEFVFRFGQGTERQQLEMAVKRRYDLSEPANVPEAYGSGVVIDKSGLVLTTFHVVRGATKVYVRLPGGKGSYADIHAADPRSDLAVLRLLDESIAPFPTIKFGDGGKVRKGQWVICLANPYAAGFRDGSPSASWGIVSNVRRRAPGKPQPDGKEKSLHRYGTLIQTDARMALGCSGGALINLKGEMVGLTTALAALTGTETAGGFAVPIDARMKQIIEVLRQGKEVEYGFLGISFGDNSFARAGVVIGGTVPGSPAYHERLYPGARIVKVNGVPMRENDDLLLAIGGSLAGSRIVLEVEPRATRVEVTLTKLYVSESGIAANRPEPFRGLRVDYTSVWYQRLSPFEVHVSRGILRGVMISEVLPGSPSRAAQLRVDDVITEVNGRPIASPSEFYQVVKNLNGPVELTLTGPDGSPRIVRID
jgi:S1-C subfamily serine protease